MSLNWTDLFSIIIEIFKLLLSPKEIQGVEGQDAEGIGLTQFGGMRRSKHISTTPG